MVNFTAYRMKEKMWWGSKCLVCRNIMTYSVWNNIWHWHVKCYRSQIELSPSEHIHLTACLEAHEAQLLLIYWGFWRRFIHNSTLCRYSAHALCWCCKQKHKAEVKQWWNIEFFKKMQKWDFFSSKFQVTQEYSILNKMYVIIMLFFILQKMNWQRVCYGHLFSGSNFLNTFLPDIRFSSLVSSLGRTCHFIYLSKCHII